jgi:hypothetical protein
MSSSIDAGFTTARLTGEVVRVGDSGYEAARKVITPYDDTVQYLRQQLPIGHDYQGLNWCGQDVNDSWTEWSWADTKEFLQVHLSRDGHLGILRLAEGGCTGP